MEENLDIISRDEALHRQEVVQRAEHVWVLAFIVALFIFACIPFLFDLGTLGLVSGLLLGLILIGVIAEWWMRMLKTRKANAILCSKCGRDYVVRDLRHRDSCNTWLTGLCASCHTPVLEPRPEPEGVTNAQRLSLSELSSRTRTHQTIVTIIMVAILIGMLLLAFPGTEWLKNRGLIPIESWQGTLLFFVGFIAFIIALAYALDWIGHRYGVHCPHCGKPVQHAEPVRATGRCLACGARIISDSAPAA